MTLNTCKMWSHGIEIASFAPRNHKNHPAQRGFAPKLFKLFKLHWFAQYVYIWYTPFTLGLSPLPKEILGYVPNTSNGFWSSNQKNLGSYTPPRKTPSRNYISPKNTWPKLHYPEHTFPWTCIFQKLHFPEHTLARNYIFLNVHLPEITFSWTCTFQKLYFPEHALARMYISPNAHLAECTFGRKYISPKTYFPEFTLARMYIWPKVHFPENLFSRIYTCQNVHLAESTFPRKLIFQNFY